MMKFYPDGCPGQKLPRFQLRVISGSSDEPEQAASQLQGAGGTKYLRPLIEKAHMELNKRS